MDEASRRRPGRMRHALVVAGIALSLVLVVGAGLLMRSFVSLVRVDLGFDPRSILVMFVTFPRDTYETPADRARLYADALQRIASLPGVAGPAAGGIPAFGAGFISLLDIAGLPADPQRTAGVQFCTASYFDTLGLRFLRGAGFDDGLAESPPRHAVINQTLATSYFGTRDPIGHSLTVMVPTSGVGTPERTSFHIVGVVADVRNRGAHEPTAPAVYLPGAALNGNPAVLVRTAIAPTAAAGAVRSAIRATHRHAIVREPGTIEDLLDRNVYAQPRFSLLIIAVFAVAATLLVGVGIFSVMAYAVSRQTREIAVRLALGASRADVMRGVFRVGGRLVVLGTAVGLLGSLATSRLLAGQLLDTSPYDPATVLGAVTLVVLTALLACYVPARRATLTDPMAALRQD